MGDGDGNGGSLCLMILYLCLWAEAGRLLWPWRALPLLQLQLPEVCRSWPAAGERAGRWNSRSHHPVTQSSQCLFKIKPQNRNRNNMGSSLFTQTKKRKMEQLTEDDRESCSPIVLCCDSSLNDMNDDWLNHSSTCSTVSPRIQFLYLLSTCLEVHSEF